jgi:hypothetical protein
MLGRPYNLLMQHALYRALPHREGGGVPRDIVTGHYSRAAVRAQLRKELKSIRNIDMFSLLAARSKTTTTRTKGKKTTNNGTEHGR